LLNSYVQVAFRAETSNLGIHSKRTMILLHATHWLPIWQDWCCRASRELCL